jgi:hypothetical protein
MPISCLMLAQSVIWGPFEDGLILGGKFTSEEKEDGKQAEVAALDYDTEGVGC